MLYVVLGGAVLWLALSAYRRTPSLRRGRWRVGSGLLASVLLAAGGFMMVRGEWAPGGAVVVLALVLAGLARSERKLRRPPRAPAVDVSLAEARALLGVADDADAETIQAAYTRLMRVAHPDRGGTTGLAAQLNAARDRLLKR